MTKRAIALSSIALLLSAGLAAYLYAPTYIINKIETDYPGVKIGSVQAFSMEQITLKDVDVVKPGIKAHLNFVQISTFDKSVKINGGSVKVEVSDETKASVSSSTKSKITAEGLWVTINAPKHNLMATLGEVSYQDGIIKASRGEFKLNDIKGTFENFERRNKVFTVQHVHASTNKPLPVKGDIDIENSTISKDGDYYNIKAQTIVIGNNTAQEINLHFKSFEEFTAEATSVTINHPWIHSTNVTFRNSLKFDMYGAGFHSSSGKAVFNWDKQTRTFDGNGSCSDWSSALPDGLKEPLEGLQFTGDLSFKADLGEKPGLKIKGSCKTSCEAPQLKALKGKFTYKVYNSKGERVERESGPGSISWAALPVNTALPRAIITLEDPNYLDHRGWIAGAFENSLIDNLSKQKFVRGGSTITMQLAKNLWLNRDKTIGRKVQEVLLASAIESCFNKDEILELYMNVVEFGPDLYGIQAASQKYFQVGYYELNAVQSFWLASILPAPKKAGMPDEPALKRTKALMDLLVKNNRLSSDVTTDVKDGIEEADPTTVQ